MRKLLIIGNGFDLDLGWRTSYSDFAKSPEWNDIEFNSQLGYELKREARINRWLDLEMLLYRFACHDNLMSNFPKRISLVPVKDEITYDSMCRQLAKYLKRVTTSPVKSDSVAARILRIMMQSGELEKIYTFNYTPLRLVISKLSLMNYLSPTKIFHVHGTIEDNTSILGIHDTDKVDHSYNYMIKGYSEHFQSNRLSIDLLGADEIVFFGLSMGEVDNLYFENYFKYLHQASIEETSKKIVRIVTLDNSGRRSILDNINSINGVRATDLYQRLDFGFIHTKNPNDPNLEKYVTRLRQASQQSRRVSYRVIKRNDNR